MRECYSGIVAERREERVRFVGLRGHVVDMTLIRLPQSVTLENLVILCVLSHTAVFSSKLLKPPVNRVGVEKTNYRTYYGSERVKGVRLSPYPFSLSLRTAANFFQSNFIRFFKE